MLNILSRQKEEEVGLFESGPQGDLVFVSELYHNDHVSKHSGNNLHLEENVKSFVPNERISHREAVSGPGLAG